MINKSVPAVELNVLPLRLRLSTCNAVNVPTDVIFVCAAVVSVTSAT